MPRIALDDLGELYHDYAIFGARGRQLPGIYPLNQRCKMPILAAYIQWAIAKCRTTLDTPVSFTELFCADGFYAMLARHLGADRCFGIDSDKDGFFTRAREIAARLELDGVRFVTADVRAMHRFERTDIVANLGGLYHVEDPAEVLRLSSRLARRYLIVQSVVSLARTEDDYFETPAPGWTWGSRFSAGWLDRRIEELGGTVVDRHAHELAGNDRPEDRGSVAYLVRLPAA